jgi:hypothetical protein
VPKRARTFSRRAWTSPSATTLLWRLAHAPRRLPAGLLVKYAWLSARETRSARPTTRTERAISRQ